MKDGAELHFDADGRRYTLSIDGRPVVYGEASSSAERVEVEREAQQKRITITVEGENESGEITDKSER